MASEVNEKHFKEQDIEHVDLKIHVCGFRSSGIENRPPIEPKMNTCVAVHRSIKQKMKNRNSLPVFA
jgi:hypothetical protein